MFKVNTYTSLTSCQNNNKQYARNKNVNQFVKMTVKSTTRYFHQSIKNFQKSKPGYRCISLLVARSDRLSSITQLRAEPSAEYVMNVFSALSHVLGKKKKILKLILQYIMSSYFYVENHGSSRQKTASQVEGL